MSETLRVLTSKGSVMGYMLLCRIRDDNLRITLSDQAKFNVDE